MSSEDSKENKESAKSKGKKRSLREKSESSLGFFFGLGILGVLVLGIVILVFEGQFYTRVESYEKAVSFIFGKVEKQPLATGFHWRMPFPLQHIEVVNVETERKVQLGFRMGEGDSGRVHLEREGLVLTKNGNILDVEAEINYHISDVVNYVIQVEDPEATVQDAAESAFRTIMGQYTINDVLTDKKSDITSKSHKRMQSILDSYKMGVIISRVQFIKVLNPLQVRDAFESVEAAKQDSAISVENAMSYQNKMIPEARGKAVQDIRAAEAYANKRMSLAKGEVELFNQLYDSYRISKRVTRKRLYLETMEEVLPGKKKFIVDKQGSTINLLDLGRK